MAQGQAFFRPRSDSPRLTPGPDLSAASYRSLPSREVARASTNQPLRLLTCANSATRTAGLTRCLNLWPPSDGLLLFLLLPLHSSKASVSFFLLFGFVLSLIVTLYRPACSLLCKANPPLPLHSFRSVRSYRRYLFTMRLSVFALLSASLASLAAAYTQPVGDTPSGNPTIHPAAGEIVPGGAPYTISWTVSIMRHYFTKFELR